MQLSVFHAAPHYNNSSDQTLCWCYTKDGSWVAKNIAILAKMWRAVNTLFFQMTGHILSKVFLNLTQKVEILSKVENTRPYSKYDRKIIGHLKK